MLTLGVSKLYAMYHLLIIIVPVPKSQRNGVWQVIR